MTTRKDMGWAIDLGSPDKSYSLLGRYAFSHVVPDHFSTYRIAVFRTRRMARAALMKWKSPAGSYNSFPKARVVKVVITVEETKP